MTSALHERGIVPLDELPVGRSATLDDVAHNVDKLLAFMFRKVAVSTFVDAFVLNRATLVATLRQAFVTVFFSEQPMDNKLAALDELLAAGARGDANMRVSFRRTYTHKSIDKSIPDTTTSETYSVKFCEHLQRQMWSNADVWPLVHFEPRLRQFFDTSTK